jgi:DNA repair exonuclease SbcCD ATPase subunit/DNA repair exonuclease SbcCD nuclease subunit
MRAIFTSDWQAELENLDILRSVNKEILAYCEKYDVRTVVHCGDLKRPYNPLDGRMVNAVMTMISEYWNNRIQFLMVLGNHDRFGLHTDGDNWLHVLRKAGALAYDQPSIVRPMSGINGGLLAFLPFRQSPVLMRREAHDLAKKVYNRKDKKEGVVLVFHSDLNLARYNVRTSSEADISTSDLCPNKYLVCIGGHIHLQQQVKDNVYYVGSPFATDWGEANQRKGYLMYDWEEKKLSKLPSAIPGMFDPTWPEFPKDKKNWQGAKVRIHVSVDCASDIFTIVQKAKSDAEKQYPGAEIVAVPELTQAQEARIKLSAQDSDEQKVRAYVEQTIDESLGAQKEKVIKYLVSRLHGVGSVGRRTGKLTFLDSYCENFLSFEKLKIQYEPGLTVVSGVNEDRKKKSNGSGKTSFLSPPPVALFGSTFKGQKHDHWMFRWTDKKSRSFAGVRFKNQAGHLCKVVRGRQPKFLRLWVDGKEQAAGNRPEEAQEAVVALTGFTWETLSGALFVDQRKTNLMLTGTESERKQFLSRLQGLDRFEKALVDVKEDLASVERKVAELTYKLDLANNTYVSAALAVKELEAESPDIAGTKKRLAEKLLVVSKQKERLLSVRKAGMSQRKELEKRRDQILNELRLLDTKTGGLSERIRSFGSKVDKLSGITSAECPLCEQSIDHEHKDSVVENVKAAKAENEKMLSTLLAKSQKLSVQFLVAKKKVVEWESGNEELEGMIRTHVAEVASLQEQVRSAVESQNRLVASTRARESAKAVLLAAQATLEKSRSAVPVLQYCVSAFSRKGMPAFLNAQLCPILNKAAAYYSQLFSEKEIQVVFNVNENGESDVQVVNANGGSEVADQSQGEMRIASLITSFALRHVAPQTNLLILDEPGEGLDPLAARTFARGLKQVVPKFGSVFVVTHNPAILSELSDARHLVVRKKDRVSSVEVENE